MSTYQLKTEVDFKSLMSGVMLLNRLVNSSYGADVGKKATYHLLRSIMESSEIARFLEELESVDSEEVDALIIEKIISK